jgi:hypothetical protein
VSCDPKTEETCYDEWHTKAVSCALISDGGCPCPEGQERCDADLANGCVGECTDLCCDWTYEYACYGSYWDGDINFKACGTYKDGCPCPDGQTECHHGFCSDACCDMSTEQLCHGPDNTSICVPVSLPRECFVVLFNKFFSQCIPLCVCRSLLMEAALVRMVKRGVEQVSLFVYHTKIRIT